MQWFPAILILPYVFILLKIYRGLLKIRPFVASGGKGIFVSVIVSCRNEQEKLPALLKCLSLQDYPNCLFEVIIVNDNSTDNTENVVSGFSGINNLISMNNKGQGKKQAIRSGIGESSGELIITTDADCTMGINWISSIAAFYNRFRPDMIICPVQVESVSGFFGRFQEIEFLSLQGITAGSVAEGNGIMCNGANLAFKKVSYLKNVINLHFEIASGDDVFLLHSIKKQKNSSILWLESRDALVTAGSASHIVSYLNQRKRWLSKYRAYKDRGTILLGIVTFVTILMQVLVYIMSVFDVRYIPVMLIFLLLKFLPDFLILQNTSSRYKRMKLMFWFLPAQLVYPFYVLGVIVYSVCSRKRVEV